jgi:hypothetical protein
MILNTWVLQDEVHQHSQRSALQVDACFQPPFVLPVARALDADIALELLSPAVPSISNCVSPDSRSEFHKPCVSLADGVNDRMQITEGTHNATCRLRPNPAQPDRQYGCAHDRCGSHAVKFTELRISQLAN